MFSRKQWLEEDCVYTGSLKCEACPYAVYDENGSIKCEKEMYEKCMNNEEA